MPSLYINEYGATLGVVNERLQVRRQGKVVQEMPALHLERVVLMVPANVTQPAVQFLMERGIDVVYLSPNGKFYGQFTRGEGKSVEQRLAQFQKFLDPAFRLSLAKAFINGKVQNMMALWRTLRRQREGARELATMAKIHQNLASSQSLESLLGLEGASSAAHFQLLRRLLPHEWNFHRRSPHPPPDPVNAMLSLGYTLLYSRMAGLLHMHGLDPYLGFFHERKHGHAALASDMIEEWRAFMVDAVVLGLIAQKKIAVGDFEKNAHGCRMARPALQTFIAAFEKRLQQSQALYSAQDSGDPLGGLEGQVRQLIRVLLGKQMHYAAVKA